MKLKILIFLFIIVNCYAEDSLKVLNEIKNNSKYIYKASKIFNIDTSILESIIYTERKLNYDWTDEVFDLALANLGKNSSIGFCQVKIKTAYFIETQLKDSASLFFPGKKYSNILRVSKTVSQLINKLMVDSINILYAAAYIRIIQSIWKYKGYSIDERPEIIESLYQLGLFKNDGSIREPRWNPIANEFGLFVKEYLYLFYN